MADLASIGFRADTKELEKASGTLTKLKQAANGMTPAASGIAKAMESASRSFLAAATGMTKAIAALVAATQGASKAQVKAASDAAKFTQSIYEAATAQERLTTATVKSSNAIKKQIVDLSVLNRINKITGVTSLSGKSAADSADIFNQAANPPIARDQMPNRFNTANIAAQFQDIGVTASMGMSPMLIAFQQGTQLSAIINSMERPLQGIGQAFTSIINPVSLLSIALTGLAVVGLQMVDWISVGKTALNGLADGLEAVGPYALAAAGSLALMYAPAIITGLTTVAMGILSIGKSALVAGAQMAAAWVVGMGPFGWVMAGILAITGAMFVFKKELSNILGVDVMKAVKDGLNGLIGGFLGAFEGIWAMAKELWARLKGEGSKTLGEAFGDAFQGAMKRDYVGIISNRANELIDSASAKLRALAEGLGKTDEKKKKTKKESDSKDPWLDMIEGADRRIATLQAERDAIGETAFETDRLKYLTELLNEANQKGIDLSSSQTETLKNKAIEMASVAEQTSILKERLDFAKSSTKGFFDDMKSGLQQGESLWKSFGDAVLNVLNKILDKFTDQGINAIFEALKAGSKTGGSGIFSTIGSALFGSDASSSPMSAAASAANGITWNAKGGAYTNGIFNDPTMFAFASGGSFGVMGEAGPEAVMPLQRGPDGSLGVRLNGDTGSGQKPTVNVEVVVNGNATVDQQTSTGTDGSELRRFIINTVNQANATGEMDASNGGRYGLSPRRVAR